MWVKSVPESFQIIACRRAKTPHITSAATPPIANHESRARAPWCKESLRLGAICREGTSERLQITVRRRSGSGAFTVRATYPG